MGEEGGGRGFCRLCLLIVIYTSGCSLTVQRARGVYVADVSDRFGLCWLISDNYPVEV